MISGENSRRVIVQGSSSRDWLQALEFWISRNHPGSLVLPHHHFFYDDERSLAHLLQLSIRYKRSKIQQQTANSCFSEWVGQWDCGLTFVWPTVRYLHKTPPVSVCFVCAATHKAHNSSVVMQHGECLGQSSPGPAWRAAANAGTCVTVVNELARSAPCSNYLNGLIQNLFIVESVN